MTSGGRGSGAWARGAHQAGLAVVVGAVCGLGAALFLHGLAHVTAHRAGDGSLGGDRLLFALPLAGLALGWVLERFGRLSDGRSVMAGQELVLEALHGGHRAVPRRLGPVVVLGTLVTHAFGGSAGREGTAVQMGAAAGEAVATHLRAPRVWRRALIQAGVAGGFGAVFGTPLAAILFALELPTVGRLEARGLLPATLAAVTGDLVARALGATHDALPRPAEVALTAPLALGWVLFGGVMAGAARGHMALVGAVRAVSARILPRLAWRLAAGGLAVTVVASVLGAQDALGLSLPMMQDAFAGTPASPWWDMLAVPWPLAAALLAVAIKLVLTALTVGTGFPGGEVTPLLVVGAVLGAALADPLGVSPALAAGVGMAAVFGAAANTPLALVVMAVEVLGAAVLPHAVLATVSAWYLTGRRGLHAGQRVAVTKDGEDATSLESQGLPPHQG